MSLSSFKLSISFASFLLSFLYFLVSLMGSFSLNMMIFLTQNSLSKYTVRNGIMISDNDIPIHMRESHIKFIKILCCLDKNVLLMYVCQAMQMQKMEYSTIL